MPYSNVDGEAVVQVSGGFGNQLFQYAFGKQLEADRGCRVLYDVDFYKASHAVTHNRLHLDKLGFDLPIYAGRSARLRLARKLKRLSPHLQQGIVGLAYLKCPATQYQPVHPVTGQAYYAGLWQSPKYFAGIETEIRDAYRERLLASVPDSPEIRPDVIGFHVRRGDYLAHKQSHNLDYVAYLDAALARLKDVTGRTNWKISVYTDAPEWCDDNLGDHDIEVNRDNGMLDDFLGLMQCEHKIISNSTFSWWAAFLGAEAGGLTLAPQHWHADVNVDSSEILMKDWIVIDS